jgi:hypothetical protein
MTKMKKLIFAMSLFLSTSVAIFAQETKTVEATANGPEISFTELVHDYGNVKLNGDGTCEFEFTNTGNEPLILSRPKSSCGCTVPTWPNQPILPGEKEKIKVTYNTAKAGAFNKTVTVTSNAKVNNNVVLRIKGTVLAPTDETLPIKKNDLAPATK